MAAAPAVEVPDASLLELAATAARLGGQDLRATLRSVTEAGVDLTGAEYGAFFYSGQDEQGGRLDVYVLSGAAADAFPDEVPVRHTDLFAPTFAGHDVVRMADVLADHRYGSNASGGVPTGHVPVRSYLAVPVVAPGGRVLGALLFGSREPDRFDERAEIAARALAVHAATAAENARLLDAAERARDRAERAARRLELLLGVTALLATASATDQIAAAVPRALTSALGCWGCALHLLPSGHLLPAAGARALADPAADEAVRTRRAAQRAAPGGAGVVLAVPVLGSQRQALGALSTTWAEPGAVDDEVRDLLAAVAGQLGQALERAYLHEAERAARSELSASVEALTDLARGLQHGLLPRRLPELPRVRVAVRYQPALSGSEVGGDWYDVVALEDGTVTVVIGDVQGHSTTAAGLMGQLRTAVRAYLTEGHDVATALARTNALLVQMHVELFATCCLVRLDQGTGTLVAATAGHPPPLLATGGGRVSEPDLPVGVPLGILEGSTYETATVRLAGPARVVLYTDGVVESAGDREQRGLAAVRAALQRAPVGEVGCERVADAVLAGIPHRLTDDAALLVLDYAGPLEQREESELALPPDLASVQRARRFVCERLRAWGVDELSDAAQLVTSELVTNAVTHTGTPTRLVLSHEPATGAVRVCVSDGSTRHPAVRDAGTEALGGRGLAIVEALAESWGVADRGDGKVVWARLLDGG